MRLLEVDDPGNFPFRLEGGKILTDLTAPLQIRYVRRVIAADEMDVLFRDALAARLAWEWAESITQTASVSQQMMLFYERKLQTARAADGQEDDHQKLESCSFLDARW
jgi:hypothetical protein